MREFFNQCWHKDLVFRSGWELNHPLLPEHKKPGQISIYENLGEAIQWLKDGQYRYEPLITGMIRPVEGDIQQAYQNLKNNPDENLGVMIQWQE